MYRTIIFPVVLYECETWYLILREECQLSVFENWVLRKMFGPTGDELTGEWRRLHNAKLLDLYSLSYIIWVVRSRRMRWFGHVVRIGWGIVAYRVLVWEPGGMRPLRRHKRKWEHNTKQIFNTIGGMD
jgi:hypothetical protein